MCLLRVRRSITVRPLYSLVNLSLSCRRMPLKICLVYLRLRNMNVIWGFLLWWGRIEGPALIIFKRGFGISFRGGRKNYFPKRVRKCYWKRLCKPFPLFLWVVLNFLWVFVMILNLWLENFDRVNEVIEVRYIGKNGIFYVNQNQKGALVLESWWSSMRPF